MEPTISNRPSGKRAAFPLIVALALAGLCAVLLAGAIQVGARPAPVPALRLTAEPGSAGPVAPQPKAPAGPAWVAALLQAGRAAGPTDPVWISKGESDANPYLGDRITYTIYLTNTTGVTVTNVQLQDVLPVAVPAESIICNGCAWAGRGLTYTSEAEGGASSPSSAMPSAAPAPQGAAPACTTCASAERAKLPAPAHLAARAARGAVRPSATTAAEVREVLSSPASSPGPRAAESPAPSAAPAATGIEPLAAAAPAPASASYAVTPSFTAAPIAGYRDLTVFFTSTSTGPITSTLWDFGDPPTSSEITPTHTYTTSGSYTVTLTVCGGDDCVPLTRSNYVTVYEPPEAAFSATPLSGCAVLTVTFTNASQGYYTSTLWTFGDGGTSSEANPSHAYATPGSYTVTLTISGPGTTSTYTESDYITVYEPPHPSFTGAPTVGYPDLAVAFSNASTGYITSYLWDFGDSTTSTAISPTHTYKTPGNYTVALTGCGAGTCVRLTKSNYVTVWEPPHAAFSASPVVGCAVLTVTFSNTSQGYYTSTLWAFGDGSTSTEVSPSHAYAMPGTYAVTLTVSGPGRASSQTRSSYIAVYEMPQPAFEGTPTTGPVPLVVTFTNGTTGNYNSSAWDFGDGTSVITLTGSHCGDPVTHTYAAPGSYNVLLQVGGPCITTTVGSMAEHYINPYRLPVTAWVAESLSWSLGSLGPHETISVTFSMPVQGVPDGALLTNRAFVSYVYQSAHRAGMSEAVMARAQMRFTGSGEGQILALPVWVAPPEGVAYAQDWGDFDGDGYLDLAVTGESGPAVYRNVGGQLTLFWRDSTRSDLAADVLWADLDGDNLPELVLVGSGGLATYAYEAQSGGFVLRQAFAITEPWLLATSVAAADFDRDGYLDLAISYGPNPAYNYATLPPSCPVGLYRNDGTGQLSWISCIGAPGGTAYATSRRMSVADQDNDGKTDLLATLDSGFRHTATYCWRACRCGFYLFGCWWWNCWTTCASYTYWTYDVALRVGTISATVATPPEEPAPWTWPGAQEVPGAGSSTRYAYDLAWGDYDRDGYLDLAIAYGNPNVKGAEYRIFKNVDGIGQDYVLAGGPWATDTPRALDWGDCDGDGQLELIVAGQPPLVIRYTGSGFEQRLLWPESTDLTGVIEGGDTVFRMRWVDYDNDGDLDLSMSSNRLPAAVFANFAPPLSRSPLLSDTWAATSVAWGDADGDGNLDLLFGAGSTVGARLYRNVNGSFDAARYTTLSSSGYGPHDVAWGDYNADGKLELAVTQGSGWHTLVYNNTAQDRGPAWDVAMGFGGQALAWGYSSWMHGGLDLLVGGDGGAHLYSYQVPTGTLSSEPAVITAAATRSVAWGDLDRDMLLDIALVADGQAAVYRNNGDGTFSPVPVITQSVAITRGIQAASVVAWADYDGDGRLELTVGSDPGPLVICKYDAAAKAFVPAWTSGDEFHTTSVAWGDWENDGDLDLAVGNTQEPNCVYLNLARQGSPGRLACLWKADETLATTGLAWGDMDGDGDLDLAVASWDGPRIYMNNYARPSHQTEHFARTMPLPNNPSYLSIARPGSTAAAYLRSSPEILTSPVVISYTLYDPDGTRDELVRNAPGDPILDTRYEYSLDGGGTWHRATPASGWSGPVTSTSRLGRPASFLWDAAADAAIGDDARFRITIVNGNSHGPVQRDRVSAVSPPFRVRGTTCLWPEYPSMRLEPEQPTMGHPVLFTGYVVRASGPLTFTWDFGDGTPVQRGQRTWHTFTRRGTFHVTMAVQSAACPVAMTVATWKDITICFPYSYRLPLIAKSPADAPAGP